MMAAERYYREHRLVFKISNPDQKQVMEFSMTTEDAVQVTELLPHVGSVADITSDDPEFLGWTVEEIARRMGDAAEGGSL